MVHFTKVIITIIIKLARGEKYIKKGIIMKEIGVMINVMAKDFFMIVKMDLNTQDFGLKAMLKAKVKKYGRMVLNLLVSLKRVKNKVMGYINGQMDRSMKENSRKVVLMVQELIFGQMVLNILEVG
jgi:hypothetical protein